MKNRKVWLAAETLVILLSLTAVAVGLSSAGKGGPVLGFARSDVADQHAQGSSDGLGVLSARVPTDKADKPRKDKTPPPPEEPPSAEPTPTPPPVEPPAPEDPPIVPEEPPAPVEPPAPPAAPGTVTSVACSSGDMEDRITFAAPADGGQLDGYGLYAAPAPDGAYSLVTTAPAGALGFTVSVEATGSPYYRIVATGPGGSGAPSAVVSNDHVSIVREVTPAGGILRSSNGELVLAFPPGSVSSTATVTIEEVEGTPTGGIISLAGVYDISSSVPLASPVRLSVAYTVRVTHFQVSAAMLSQAKLMTYSAATGTWVADASNLGVADGMLSGDLSHFSYWSGAMVQPHGTQTTAYCSDGGICHNLSAYPDSTTRISSRDPQVCYNCHGSADLAGGPAGASGENVQAAIAGAGSMSRHPVAIGDLYCTACHDPHANPTSSPGMLRATDPMTGKYVQGGSGVAPAEEFCWTCHGTLSNRRIDYLVPAYWYTSGGDKKTGFNGAHTATRSSTTKLDLPDELSRGLLRSTEVTTDGTVVVSRAAIELPKTQTPVAVPPITGDFKNAPPQVKYAYDGDWSATKVYWSAAAMGATAGNGWVGSSSLTIDLGSVTEVRSFEGFFLQNFGCVADVVEIQSSNDGVAWTPVVSEGTLGTRLPEWTFNLSGTATCRYVRFVFQRRFTNGTESLVVTELAIDGVPSQGTYDVRPDIARKAPFAGGTVAWQAAVPTPATLDVTARASLDNGATWTAWSALTNGGSITQIPIGASLENAVLEVRATLTRVGSDEPLFDNIEITTTHGDVTATTPAWTGASPANECQRCHVAHGSQQTGLAVSNTILVCTNCHSAAFASYGGSAAFGTSVHRNVQCASCHTAHGNAGGTNVAYPFLLKNDRREECLSCHATVKAAFDAKQGAASEWAKHDVYAVNQAQSGSRIACRNCHSTHVSATGLVNPDNINSAFTTMRDDPTSIPTGEVVIYASKDTLLDSGAPTFNYGAATQFTITQTARALLYFDLNAVPAGATIQNATLYLWKTSPGSGGQTGSYKAYPMSRDWLEGTGNGEVNSAGVNGATWLERWWGDNANTGNIASGDWATVGGDYATTPTSTSSGMIALNITSLAQTLYGGTNYGIILTDSGSTTSLPMYTRHNATQQYQPRLRIVYRTGPATRQVVDDITFCSKCHDGSMPMGLSGQTLQSVATMYASGAHGGGKGLGPESDVFGYWAADQGGGGLKAPYSYGMDALPCSTCHDPHGSRLPYHLREVVNGTLTTGVPLYGYDWGYANAPQGDGLGYFCAACHIIPPSHAGYANSISNCSSGCHNHAGR